MNLVLSGWNILPAVLNIRSTSADEAGIDSTFRHSSHMRKIWSMWLLPGQEITVILQRCGFKVIHELLAHGLSKVSMIWLGALWRIFHKAEQFIFFGTGFWDSGGWSHDVVDAFIDTERVSAYFCMSMTTVLLICSISSCWHHWSLNLGSSTAPVMYNALDSYFDGRESIAELRSLIKGLQ